MAQNNTCLVFGYLNGLNIEICRAMAARKYNVAFNYSEDDADFVPGFVKELEKENIEVLSFNVSIGDFAGIESMVESIVNEWGELSVLINWCDSILIQAFDEVQPDAFSKLIEDNLTSIYFATKAALKPMIFKKKGKIVNLSSVMGEKTFGLNASVYSALKAGVIGFTKALCKEVGRYRITANTILVNNLNFKTNADCFAGETLDKLKTRIPCGYYEEEGKIAESISAICLASDYMNGQVIAVDGGITDYTI